MRKKMMMIQPLTQMEIRTMRLMSLKMSMTMAILTQILTPASVKSAVR